MKELFLDSANMDEIALCVRTDAIAGVTTNPSLMAKEAKGDYVKKLNDICQLFQTYAKARKHLSVEVTTLDPDKMYGQAHELQEALGLDFDKVQLHIKIPVMFETLEVISRLGDDGIKVNATACMTALQAKLAHDAGAPIISFFFNRMIDGAHGNNGRDLALMQLSDFSEELNRNSRVICGSIRKPQDLSDCWRNGADIVTASFKIIKETLVHPETDKAIQQFQKDIDAWLS